MPDGSTTDRIAYSAPIGDEVKTTTCYMCACRCGIRVHLKDGRVRYIEGNPDHPVNKGVLCGKGSAGIMTQYSPARLQAPLKRVARSVPIAHGVLGRAIRHAQFRRAWRFLFRQYGRRRALHHWWFLLGIW